MSEGENGPWVTCANCHQAVRRFPETQYERTYWVLRDARGSQQCPADIWGGPHSEKRPPLQVDVT